MRRAAGKFDDLVDLEYIAHCLVPFFALLHGQQVGELVEVLSTSAFILKSTWTRLLTGVLDQPVNAFCAEAMAASTSSLVQQGVLAIICPVEGS